MRGFQPRHSETASSFPKPGVQFAQCVVKFDDGMHRNMSPNYLRTETTLVLFGLARLVEAEEAIANILSHNTTVELSDDDLAEIEWVLDHAAEVLNRPGFCPEQGSAASGSAAFQYRFSICTGPPGVGKTAIVALVCAAAAKIYPGQASPILGVALAGRAASVLRDAAIFWQEVPGSRKAAWLGDQHKLQPIGPGSPFRDMIGSGVIPTVYLTENYRTNCMGIRAICDDILNGTITAKKLPEYLALGGVFYVPCDYQSRTYMIGEFMPI